jgi:hypothetical protein
MKGGTVDSWEAGDGMKRNEQCVQVKTSKVTKSLHNNQRVRQQKEEKKHVLTLQG